MHTARFSESEMRDELERRGLRTHKVASGDRATLEAMMMDHFAADLGTRISDLSTPETGGAGAIDKSNSSIRPSSSGASGASSAGPSATNPNAKQLKTVNYVEQERELRAQMDAKRRYLELLEEMAQLDGLIRAAQLPPPTCAPQRLPDPHAPPEHVARAENDEPNQAVNHIRIKVQDMENVVDVFTGDDQYHVNTFIADFEAAARQYGLTEPQMNVYAKRFVRGTAKSLLRTIDADTWADIRRELQTEFAPMLTAASIHKTLSSRRKKHHETPQQYSIAMREIAMTGQVEEADVIRYIIDGLARDKNERLFLSGATTYNELRTTLHRYQEMIANSPSVVKPALYDHNRPALRTPDDRRIAPAADGGGRTQSLKCFNCNEAGHYASGCNKPKRPPNSCFKCGSIGHQQNQCTATPAKTPTTKDFKKEKLEIANVDTADDEEYNFVEVVSLYLNNGESNTAIKIKARMDTASPISFIQKRYVPLKFLESMRNISEGHVGLNNSPMNELGTLKVSILFRNSTTNDNQISVVKDGTMRSAAIIGRDFMKRVGLLLAYKDELKPKSPGSTSPSLEPTEYQSAVSEILSIDGGAVAIPFEINSKLEHSHLAFVLDLVQSCRSVADYDSIHSDHTLNIRLSKDSTFHSAPRRLSVAAKESVQGILQQMLKQKVIRPSCSPYSSPIVLTKKKCGSTRMVIDYRELNKITERDNYPLPLIEDQIDSLHEKRFFTCLDLKDGFTTCESQKTRSNIRRS